MASFTAGTTFTDGVANDVTAAKLAALVNAATPTSGLIQDRTAETIIAVNDNLLVSDASDSNNLKRMTVANFRSAATFGTTTSTAATITTGTIATLNSTTGTIATLNSTTGTIATLNSTTGTIATLNSTTGTITTGVIPTLTSITKITSGTGTAAAPAISPTGDTNTGVFFPAADTIAFSEGGAEAMRIDSSGNVGIGVSSLTNKLDVNGGVTLRAVGGEGGQMQLLNPGNASVGLDIDVSTENTGRIFCTNNNSSLQLGQLVGTGGTVTLHTAASERLRIDASGNVGIGSTSPDARLEIQGTGSTASNPSTTSSIDTTIGLRSSLGIGNGGMLMFGSNQGYHVAIKGFLTGNSSNTTGDLLFCTRTNATNTTLTEAMRIDSGGNVGIGTASPAAKLDVSGSFNATSGTIPTLVSTTLITTGTGTAAAPAIVPTGDTNTGIFFPAADTIAFSEGATEAMRINSSGNVSIGTATALSKLHVHGDLTMSNATTAVTASTSTITPPATVAGYLTVSINGTSRKIAYYAT